MSSNRALNWGLAILAVLVPLMAVGFVKWREAAKTGGQGEAEPFHIAGNFYFVGATDVSIFLITSPEGHILIDGGYPNTPRLITASIAKLGFDIKDVKIILSSHAHYDHAGGLAELQKASGAAVYASEASAETIEAGGDDIDETVLVFKLLVASGLGRYTPVEVTRRLKTGDKIRLGPNEVTAHVTSGHTKGCTTFSFQVREKNRTLNVVDACSLELLTGMRLADPQRYKGIHEDFERSFATLRSLPADIWVTSHGRPWGRYRKFSASMTSEDPVAPFIDRDGYRAFIDTGETRFRDLLVRQQMRP